MIKFKYYKTENKFRSDLTGNKIDSDDIVFVEDSGILSTHSLEWGFVDRINGFLPLSDDWAILKGDVHQGPTIIHRWPGSNGGSDTYATINFPYLYSGDSLTLATTEQLPEPDWNETVTTSKNYIKNKPDLSEINEKLGILNHEYVDLGLPSGTLWATMNVGATSVTDYGNYYMYGMGAETYDSSDTPYQGTENPLPEEYDTAAQVWGEGWRMPTLAQFQELVNNTTYQWVTNYQSSGINGGLVTGPNGNTIFLPATGFYTNGSLNGVSYFAFYWTTTPNGNSTVDTQGFTSDGWTSSLFSRESGLPVRPVHAPSSVSPAKVKDAIGINSSTGSATKYLNEQGSFTTIASDATKQNKITTTGILYGNGNGSVTAADSSDITGTLGYTPVRSVNTKTGIVSLTASDVLALSIDRAQTITSEQQGYARANIGLGNVGNFKAVSTVASQGLTTTEQANARANIGAGTSNFSGNYNDLSNKPTIPTVPTTVSSFTNDAGYLTQHLNISGKEDKTAIVASTASSTLNTLAGKYHRITTAVGTMTITLPAITDLTTVSTVVVYLTAGTTPAVTISAADNKSVYYQDGFEIEAGSTYEINALFNGAAWIVAAVKVNVL